MNASIFLIRRATPSVPEERLYPTIDFQMAPTKHRPSKRSKRTDTPRKSVLRSYRSRKQPACNSCRRRKSRCAVDIPGQACLLCRLHEHPCNLADGTGQPFNREDPGSSNPPPLYAGESPRRRQYGTFRASKGAPFIVATLEGTVQESSHIIGPAGNNDAHKVQKYLEGTVGPSRRLPYLVYSKDSRRPITFLPVPRQHGGVKFHKAPGADQCEIVAKLVEPFSEELTELYFQQVHPCFPLLHEASIRSLHVNDRDLFPHALRCDIYATALKFWNTSSRLKPHYQPDITYIWSLGIRALNDDFISPSLATLCAAVHTLAGRPVTTMTGNAVNLGRTVALAHSLGLNHDPRQWNLDKDEISLRIRAWWAVLIHDRRLSLAHGTPPNIPQHNYDVPLPLLRDLVADPSGQAAIDAGEGFLALCRLTETLGRVLEHIHKLTDRDLEYSESYLDWLPLEHWNERVSSNAKGVKNLQLAELALKILVCRMRLNAVLDSAVDGLDSVTRCHNAAENVVELVRSLDVGNLHDFWMPYAGYHIASACILLLR